MPSRALTKLRKICLALPEATEVSAWGTSTFRVGKIFAMFASASSYGRNAVWLKAAPGDQPRMVQAAPDTFFVPPYVGKGGWIGIWLDGYPQGQDADWDDVAEFVGESYRMVRASLPKKKASTKPRSKSAVPRTRKRKTASSKKAAKR